MALITHLRLRRSKCELIIGFKKGMYKETGNSGVTAMVGQTICMMLDSDLPFERMMIAFSHEMVHVKQLAKGTLKTWFEGAEEFTFWCGKRIDTNKLRYIDKPWEAQAFKMQEINLRQALPIN